MDAAQLQLILAELRAAGTDTAAVEVKRSQTQLPTTVWETMSAFANTNGGLLVLGVDEAGGAFPITGVDDPAKVVGDLQAACAELEPPLRPAIDVIQIDGKMVITAEIVAVPNSRRPCHRAHDGPRQASFVRVGDGDQHLAAAEVDEMLASRSGHDHSLRPAPDGTRLSDSACEAFCAAVRTHRPRRISSSDEEILRSFGALGSDGQPSLAGALALGDDPAGLVQAAQWTLRRFPSDGDPIGTRHAGTHIEGTIGELMDDALDWLEKTLDRTQVERNGRLYDDLDVPIEALREVISNALVHRSFTVESETRPVLIEVSDDTVVVTSPGGLYMGTDARLLGLEFSNGLRNNTLVRICELLHTPTGARIVEHQNVGIKSADEACHVAGTLPPLFVDLPASFQVIMPRRSLDTRGAVARLTAQSIEATPERVRVLASIARIGELRAIATVSGIGRLGFDARLCARVLAPASLEDAAGVLRELERAGLIVRSHLGGTPSWTLAPTPAAAAPSDDPNPKGRTTKPKPAKQPKIDRVGEVLEMIDNATGQELSAKQIGMNLGLTSPNSRARWINRALEHELIEHTKANGFDPTNTYRLTRKGRETVAAARSRRSKTDR